MQLNVGVLTHGYKSGGLVGFISKLTFSIAIISFLVLSGCSSNNDTTTNSSPGNQVSSPVSDDISEDREILSDPSGDNTSAIAGLWNANTDEAERFVEISNAGLYTDYSYNGSVSNCYFVTPMTLNLELEATDSTPATFSTSDGRSFTAAVIDSRLAVTLISDDSVVGAEIDTTTQNWSAAEGIMAIDLPVCTEEVPIEEIVEALVPRPQLTSAQCEAQGGSIIGDIGDGAIHRPEYRCASGAAPIGQITFLEGEPIPTEGAVCCL